MKQGFSFIEILIVVAIIAFIALIALPTGPSKAQREANRKKLEQNIAPLSFENTEAAIVIQDVVSRLAIPVRIRLCRQFTTKLITVRTDHEANLADILNEVGQQLGCDVRLYTGQHGELLKPQFVCPSAQNDYMEIERQSAGTS